MENQPRHSATLGAHYNLLESVELDGIVRFVDELDRTNIDSYAELDLRVGWRPWHNLELTLIGRNLIENSHQEFRSWTFQLPLSEVERSVFAQATYLF